MQISSGGSGCTISKEYPKLHKNFGWSLCHTFYMHAWNCSSPVVLLSIASSIWVYFKFTYLYMQEVLSIIGNIYTKPLIYYAISLACSITDMYTKRRLKHGRSKFIISQTEPTLNWVHIELKADPWITHGFYFYKPNWARRHIIETTWCHSVANGYDEGSVYAMTL